MGIRKLKWIKKGFICDKLLGIQTGVSSRQVFMSIKYTLKLKNKHMKAKSIKDFTEVDSLPITHLLGKGADIFELKMP